MDREGGSWIFFGRAEDRRVGVWATRLDGERWTTPELVSGRGQLAFNQEVTAHSDGAVECCWQQAVDGRFIILSRTWRAGRWGDTRQISGDDDNVWDPAVAALPDGSSAYVWSRYRNGAYQLVSRRGDRDRLSRECELTGGTDYALHPSLAATADGRLWCAFDMMTVQGHGGSGSTRLRETRDLGIPLLTTGMRKPSEYAPGNVLPDLAADIKVVRLDEAGVAEDVGPVAEPFEVSPAGLPRLASTPEGGLVLAYRIIRRLPVVTYYWEVAAQVLGPEGWSGPTLFENSDAGQEEPAVAASPTGAVIAWQCDNRRERNMYWVAGPTGGREIAQLREHYGEVIWHGLHGAGRVRIGTVESRGRAPRAEEPSRAGSIIVSENRREARPWASGDRPRYTTTVGGTSYGLYWGDLHRHSLVSRCTAADEPSLEDYYRYALDLCEYDFWAVTDHAEHTTAYQWWCVQKIADLFRMEGHFVPLYGFEWTSTSGHQNVIYGDVRRGAPIFSAQATESRRPDQLWTHLRRHPSYPAVTIPHHPGSAMQAHDWSYHDPEYMRLVEVFQACRGNYEHDGCFRQYSDATLRGGFVVDGLRRGYRFGLIASSDHGNGSSYVGVYAESLDRPGIFGALQARRVLGATARDIALDVRIGDTFMGEETTRQGAFEIDVSVRAYRDVARIDIVRNGELAHSVLPDLELPQAWIAVPLRIEWGMAKARADWSGTLRVLGGEVVQTAYWSPEIVDVSKDFISWSAPGLPYTKMYGVRRGGVECTVVGPPEGVVDVCAGTAELRATLRELHDGQIFQTPAPAEGRLRLQPGTGGLCSLGTREAAFRWADDPPGPGAWYYIRAFLVDGEMAWSSPIWVDRH
jgi:hypothetical protein